MKAYLLTITLLFFVGITGFSQQIWLVDNSPSIPEGDHVLPSIQAAHDSASAGDIIHVKPSEVSYGNVTITKSINIFGIGFNPDKEIPKKSVVDNIYLNDGSSNTRLSGLDVSRIYLANGPNVPFTISNIQIDNCYIDLINNNQCCSSKVVDNLLIRNNFIGNDNAYADVVIDFDDAEVVVSNVIITNNIILSSNNTGYGAIHGNGLLIKNNLFYGNNTASYEAFEVLTNSTVSNNIFYGSAPVADGASFEANVFNNNLSYMVPNDSLPPAGTGNGNSGTNNLQNVDPLFTNVPISIKYLFSYDLTPADGSPLINAGTDGTDIGPTGGTTPWDPHGVSLPLIKSILTNDVVKQGDNLNVEVKAESNN